MFFQKLELSIFPMTKAESIIRSVCVCCAKPATVFRSIVAEKEYKISRLCQGCQDKVYGSNYDSGLDHDM